MRGRPNPSINPNASCVYLISQNREEKEGGEGGEGGKEEEKGRLRRRRGFLVREGATKKKKSVPSGGQWEDVTTKIKQLERKGSGVVRRDGVRCRADHCADLDLRSW
jgi:hypothetical protein